MLCGHGTISKLEELSTFSIKHICRRMKSSTQPEKAAFSLWQGSKNKSLSPPLSNYAQETDFTHRGF